MSKRSVPNDVENAGKDSETGKTSSNASGVNRDKLSYGILDTVPPLLSLLLGLQQVIIALGGALALSFAIADALCAGPTDVIRTKILQTTMFMTGVGTVLQTLIGVRLPIFQGASSDFLPTLFVMQSSGLWKCPVPPNPAVNSTVSYSDYKESELYERITQTQGSLMLASVIQVVIGATGLIGLLLRFIGPITVSATITLVGLTLIKVAIWQAQYQWGVALFTTFMVCVFALYLHRVTIPVPVCNFTCKGKALKVVRLPLFTSFAILLAICCGWLFAYILTVANVFPDAPNENLTGRDPYMARTDSKLSLINMSVWFHFPYPGQYGTPGFSTAILIGFTIAVIASAVESVGDYFAAAMVSQVPPPPAHAINRGIFIEGVGSVISGALGACHATTSFSENISSLAITKVANRRVHALAGIIVIILAIIGKFAGALVSMPTPVIGGIQLFTFGMVVAVGVSGLRHVDLTSARNLGVFGISIFVGYAIPKWMEDNPGILASGNAEVDQVVAVVLGMPMFLGGIIAFILDVTVPGTEEERGIKKWRMSYADYETGKDKAGDEEEGHVPSYEDIEKKRHDLLDRVYGLPFLTKSRLQTIGCCKYMPLMPSFQPSAFRRKSKRDKSKPPSKQVYTVSEKL